MCYSGNCRNANNQCKKIWNENSASSDHLCYKSFNTIGFLNGNCGSSFDKFEPCSNEDALCGLINCQYGSDKPLIAVESFFKSTTTSKDKQLECKVITNASKSDLMYVNDGTACNTNKICVNRKCISAPQQKCPISEINKKLCSGNGKCNSELKCVCNQKWTGNACDYYLSEEFNTSKNNTLQKLDFNSSNLKTTTLLSIIVGFFLIFLFIFVIIFRCNRRRRTRVQSTTSIDKIEHYCHNNNNNNNNDHFDSNLNSSIKFGSLPSYRSYKLKNKSKASLKQATEEPTPTKQLNASMHSCNDNISVTKLNHAIKQLNTQPCKSILKNKPTNLENQEHYEEILNNLNDTFTNTNINAQYSTLPKRRASISSSLTTSSSSSSSSLSSSTTTLVIPTVENEIDDVNIELATDCLNEILVDEKQNSFQNKVQDYLNELNLLSKQNNFGNVDNNVLITPVKPNLYSCEKIINTNTSEASSGYVSSSTSNKDTDVKLNNNLLTSLKGSNESIIYDATAAVAIENSLMRSDKRYSYVLATASINNLNIDPE